MTDSREPRSRRAQLARRIAAGVTLLAAGAAAATAIPVMIASAEHIQSFQQPTSSADCEPVSAAEVRAAPVAFAATANRIENGAVALKVTSRYAGITAEHVRVPQGDGAAELRFRVGKRYLLAAEDERILGCGISGEATEEQRALYIQAFG